MADSGKTEGDMTKDEFTGSTVSEAKAYLRENFKDGSRCPCCKQMVKLYSRKLNAQMVRGLVWLVLRAGPTREWVNIQEGPAWLLRSKQLATCRHWGLLVSKASSDSTKKGSGLWRPTFLGHDFAYDRAQVPSHMHLFNGGCWGESDTLVGIRDTLGEFDYGELMRTRPGGE